MATAEEMRDFFTQRVEGYDVHMLKNIQGMAEAYARVAALLPEETGTLLDLGCGTGLELEAIFARFPALRVTGIDLTQAMLDALKRKYANCDISLICGDYFAVELGEGEFDAAVSVESLHHFTPAKKRGLYERVYRALGPGGVYVEADFMVFSQAEEEALFAARDEILRQPDAGDGAFHIDVPCAVDTQIRLLREAGFAAVTQEGAWGNTVILRAYRT